MSRIEKDGNERTQIDTLRRCIEALGGSLHAEVELENQRYRPTRSRIRFVVGVPYLPQYEFRIDGLQR